MEQSVWALFPESMRRTWGESLRELKSTEEIRLRLDKPILIYGDKKEWGITADGKLTKGDWGKRCITGEELQELLMHICKDSLYAFSEEIKRGYLTAEGGHRIGIAGQVILDRDNEIKGIKNVNCINIRIAHEIKGAADGIIPTLYEENKIKNTLLISPPGCGKTTVLRDMIRRVSQGNAYGEGRTVGVVDERSELAGTFLGKQQNDLGMRTDVMDSCPKKKGIEMLVRSMNPRVLAVDEIGNEEDMEAIYYGISCGSSILATIHGADIEDAMRKLGKKRFLEERPFENIILLGKKNSEFIIEKFYKDGEVYG